MSTDEMRITKRSDEDIGYSDIYRVTFPVTFYFDDDGTYDGLAFDTGDATKDEVKLLRELLFKLSGV